MNLPFIDLCLQKGDHLLNFGLLLLVLQLIAGKNLVQLNATTPVNQCHSMVLVLLQLEEQFPLIRKSLNLVHILLDVADQICKASLLRFHVVGFTVETTFGVNKVRTKVRHNSIFDLFLDHLEAVMRLSLLPLGLFQYVVDVRHEHELGVGLYSGAKLGGEFSISDLLNALTIFLFHHHRE